MFEQQGDAQRRSHAESGDQRNSKEPMHVQDAEGDEEWKILNDQHKSQFRKMISLKPDKLNKCVSLGGFEWIGEQSGKIGDQAQQHHIDQSQEGRRQKKKHHKYGKHDDSLISRREERIKGEAVVIVMMEFVGILCGGMEYIERAIRDQFADSQDQYQLGISVVYAFTALCYISYVIFKASKRQKKQETRDTDHPISENNLNANNPYSSFFEENFNQTWKNRYCMQFLVYLLILDILRIEVFLDNIEDRLFQFLLTFFINQIVLRRVHDKAGLVFSSIIVMYAQARYIYAEHEHFYIIGSGAVVTLACCLHYFALTKKQKQSKIQTEKAEYVSEYFKQFYHNIVSMMPQGILIIDESEKLVYANKTTKKILSCASKNAIIESLSRLIVGKEQPEQNFFEDTKTLRTLRTMKSFKSARSGRSAMIRKNNLPNSNLVSSFQDTESFMSTYQNPDGIPPQSVGSSSNAVAGRPLSNLPVIRPLRMIPANKQTQNLPYQQPSQSPQTQQQNHIQGASTQAAFPLNPIQSQIQLQSLRNQALSAHYQLQDQLQPFENKIQPLSGQLPQQVQNTPPMSQIDSPSRQNIDSPARQLPQSDKKLKQKSMPFKYLSHVQQNQSNFENMSVMEIISVLLKECSMSIREQSEVVANNNNNNNNINLNLNNNLANNCNISDKHSEISHQPKREDKRDSKYIAEEQPDSLSCKTNQLQPSALPANPLVPLQQVKAAQKPPFREKNFSQYSITQQRDLLGSISHARLNSNANSNSANNNNNNNNNNTGSNLQNYFKSYSMQNNFTSSGAWQNISSQRANTNTVKHQSEIAQNSLSVRVKLHDKLFEITFIQCEMSTLQMESPYDEQTSMVNTGKQISKNSSNFHRILSPPDKTSKTKSALQLRMQQSDLSNTYGQKDGIEINMQNIAQTPGQTLDAHHGLTPSSVQKKRTSSNRTAMVLVFIEDITQEVYMKRLEELNNYKMKMLSSISHELKTPLNCSMGMLEELQSFIASEQFGQTNSAEIIRNLIEPAQESNLILLSMIQDLLDMGAIEMGTLHYNFTRFNLKDLLRDRCNVMRRQCLVKKIDISLVYEESLDETIISDENRVGQILINFLSNSLKFTGKNGKIVVRVEPFGVSHVRISIEDNGIGISKQKIANIFKIFGREDITHNKRSATQGIGIGLSVSNCLVHGLTLDEFQDKPITVKSEEKKGTTFQFVLRNQEPHLINVTQTQHESDSEDDDEDDEDSQKSNQDVFQEVIVTVSRGDSLKDFESKFNENTKTKSKYDPESTSIAVAAGGGLTTLEVVKKGLNQDDDDIIDEVLQEEEQRFRKKQKLHQDSFKQKKPAGQLGMNRRTSGQETTSSRENNCQNLEFEDQNSENIDDESERPTNRFKKTQLTPVDSQQYLFDRYFNQLDLEDVHGFMQQLNMPHNNNISVLYDNCQNNSVNFMDRQGLGHNQIPSIDSISSKHLTTSHSNSFLPLNLLANTQGISSRRRESSPPQKSCSLANINGSNNEENSIVQKQNFNTTKNLFNTMNNITTNNNMLSENNTVLQSHNLSVEPNIIHMGSTTSFMNIEFMNSIEEFIISNQQRKDENFKEEFGQILIVDDVQFNLITLQSLLKKYALKIDLADDGDDAVHKVKEKYQKSGQLYKIIFMDIQMPIKDGFQATKEIRSFLAENNLYQVPIVATSAFGDQQYKEQAKKVGMTDYIEKPLKIQKIDKAFVKHVIR